MAVHNILTVNTITTCTHSHTVPSPVVALSGISGGSEFVSGSSFSLTCSIQPQGVEHVDTPTTVMSSWDAPSSEYDTDNPANASSVVLDIASLQTADTGDYTCSALVSDSSGSGYVVDSEEVTDTVSITSRCGEWESSPFMKLLSSQPDLLNVLSS